MKKACKQWIFTGFDRKKKSIGRDDKIRTCDPLHPMQVRYRAALRPEFYSVGGKGKEKNNLFPAIRFNFFLAWFFEYIFKHSVKHKTSNLIYIVILLPRIAHFPNCRLPFIKSTLR